MNQYQDLFGISTEDCRKALSRAMSRGASYADLYFENSVFKNLLLRDGAVTSGGFHTDYGTGIRALCGEKTGYSYCESTQMSDILSAADAAAAIASGSSAIPPIGNTVQIKCGNYYNALQSWDDVECSTLTSILNGLEKDLRSRESRITKVIARLSCAQSSIMMFNSLGQMSTDLRPMGSLSVTIIFTNGKTTENRSASRSFKSGFEMLSRENILSLEDELLKGIDPMLEAGRPKGGEMSVVIGAGAGGILLHEAMGHAFEADFNRKGQSVFSDKMGTQVCPRGISIVDDATLPGNRGSINVDDEGVPGQKTYMVQDGILTSYLHDRISAAHYGVAPTGNGRRESFRFAPIPRMRLTYMESGDANPADIISSVKKGIYVDEFSNGEVQIGEGDFTFYVKLGYIIENGRLGAPVKDINIIGNGPQCLEDILAVGNDLKIDNGTWTCGKDQSVAVGCGMPTVLVKNLTVGGE